MQRFILIISFFIFQSINCFSQLSNTDIWLLDVKDTNIITDPVNITDRKGYDNQPSFSPDGKYILYTSMRDDKQTDIYKYDLETKVTSQFTKTATSEYSPNVMPDGKNISVVMVEADSTQRLWKFPIKGGEPSLIIKDIDSIGYYCWINKDSLALVMTTEPSILKVVNLKTQKSKIIDTDVSRCIQKGSKTGFYYMLKSDREDRSWKLTNSNYDRYYSVVVDADGKVIKENDPSKLIEPALPEISQDYCLIFTPTDQIFVLFGYHSSIHILRWKLNDADSITDLSSFGITNITRIAISPDGKRIAIVAESKKIERLFSLF